MTRCLSCSTRELCLCGFLARKPISSQLSTGYELNIPVLSSADLVEMKITLHTEEFSLPSHSGSSRLENIPH